jgi:hypothetical protein
MTTVADFIGLVARQIQKTRDSLTEFIEQTYLGQSVTRGALDAARDRMAAMQQWAATTANFVMPERGMTPAALRFEATNLLTVLSEIEQNVLQPVIVAWRRLVAADTAPTRTLTSIVSSAATNQATQSAASTINEFINTTKLRQYLSSVPNSGLDAVYDRQTILLAKRISLAADSLSALFGYLAPDNVLSDNFSVAPLSDASLEVSPATVVAQWEPSAVGNPIAAPGIYPLTGAATESAVVAVNDAIDGGFANGAAVSYFGYAALGSGATLYSPRFASAAVAGADPTTLALGSILRLTTTGDSITVSIYFRHGIGGNEADPCVASPENTFESIEFDVTSVLYSAAGAAIETVTHRITSNNVYEFTHETIDSRYVTYTVDSIISQRTAAFGGGADVADGAAFVLSFSFAGSNTDSVHITGTDPTAWEIFQASTGTTLLAGEATYADIAGNLESLSAAQYQNGWTILQARISPHAEAYNLALMVALSDAMESRSTLLNKYAAQFNLTVVAATQALTNPYSWFNQAAPYSAMMRRDYSRWLALVSRDLQALLQSASSDKSVVSALASAFY